MKIRKAKKADLKQIARIFAEECKKKPYYEDWTISQAYKRIKGYYDAKSHILVALINDDIAGFIIFSEGVWWYGNRRFVDELYISKEFQGQGIGKTFLKKVDESFRGKGKNQVYLLSDVRSRAFKFYKKLGYKKTPWVLMKKEFK